MKKENNCKDCKKRKAIIEFSDNPYLTLTHGYGGINICRQCYIKRIEDGIEDCQNNLQKQKKLLKAELNKEVK